MKLAVYGDSFAIDDHSTAWPRILAEKLDTQKYTNFAQVGTSIDFSYYHFMENHKDFDINIFIITEGSRYSLWHHQKPLLLCNDNARVNVLHKENFKKLSRNEHKIAKTINETEHLKRQYFPEAYNHYANAMLDSMMYHNKDACYINAMLRTHKSPGMIAIQNIDYFYNNITFDDVHEKDDLRPCHMSCQQNIEFVEYMVQHLNGNININDTFVDADKHYTVSKNLELAGLGLNKS
mgnify:CR=1 FL=1